MLLQGSASGLQQQTGSSWWVLPLTGSGAMTRANCSVDARRGQVLQLTLLGPAALDAPGAEPMLSAAARRSRMTRRQQVVPRRRGVSALQQVGRVWMMCLWVYTASGARRVVVGSWLRGVTGCPLLGGLLAGSSDQGWGHVQGWGNLGVVLLPCNCISRRLFTAQGAVYAPYAQVRMLTGLTRVVQLIAALAGTDGACQQDAACQYRVTRGLRSVDMDVLL
jgi:hypothetical protein